MIHNDGHDETVRGTDKQATEISGKLNNLDRIKDSGTLDGTEETKMIPGQATSMSQLRIVKTMRHSWWTVATIAVT